MQVFAPAAFRYPAQTGTDYPYGLLDIANDSLARLLLDAGLVVATDPGDQTDNDKRPTSRITVDQAGTVAKIAYRGFIDSTLTGTGSNTSETTLASFTIPAQYFAPNSILEVFGQFSFSGSNTKTVKVKVGGQNLIATAQTTALVLPFRRELWWNNSLTSQKSANSAQVGPGASTSARATYTLDPSSGLLIEFTGTLSAAAATALETITLDAFFLQMR